MADITVIDLLNAYANGIFPMSDSRDDPDIHWVEPHQRGILPLADFHIPRRLKRTIRQSPYSITVNASFKDCVLRCAESSERRDTTWINDRIIDLYTELHEHGFAHSIESWRGSEMVGGLYGVSLGGAFFGESMFSTQTDASKIALAYLVARLKVGGYALLDTQFITDHLRQFGAVEIPQSQYLDLLRTALNIEPDFYKLPEDASPDDVLQSITQTS